MKKYRILQQYYDMWGEDVNDDNNLVTEEEIKDLARGWDVTVEELLKQVEEA